jgi:hypothetical protein
MLDGVHSRGGRCILINLIARLPIWGGPLHIDLDGCTLEPAAQFVAHPPNADRANPALGNKGFGPRMAAAMEYGVWSRRSPTASARA